MESILNSADKKYLKFFVKFLQSHGEKTGTIQIEDFDEEFLDREGNVLGILHMEENYYLDVPVEIAPIIEKVVRYCQENIPETGSYDVSSTSLEIMIDVEGSISAEYCWRYYTQDNLTNSFSEGDDDMEEVFDALRENNEGTVYVKFDGNGDSGSIESAEDDRGNILNTPAAVEDWCYRVLENNYGGWEINEGSSGQFIFDLDDLTCELDFNWNNENTECDTIYEEKFDN